MARDHQSWAVRAVWNTGGPRSGHPDNTLYFKYTGGIAPTPTEMTGIMNAVWTFWNGASGGTGKLTYHMGPQVVRATNSVLLDLYDLDLADDRHHFGSPVQTLQKTPGSSGSAA